MPRASYGKKSQSQPIEIEHRDYIQSLDKGLKLIRTFGPETPKLTLTEAARLTGMTKAAARRFLLTLRYLGYLDTDNRTYWLKPKILELGESYLTSQPWWGAAQLIVEEAARRTAESCSLCVLDGAEIVYVCRVAVSRFLTSNISIGSRLPAYPTALGRVMLAQLPTDELQHVLSGVSLTKFTKKTVMSRKTLLEAINRTRVDGYCVVDQELEEGLVGLAVPILNSIEAYAALGVSVHAGRVPKQKMLKRFLPILKDSAKRIGMHAI